MIKRPVECAQRGSRVHAFEVDGVTVAAAINIGASEASIVDNAAGDYTLTFSEQFERQPIAIATSLTTGVLCEIKAVSKTAVQVNCYDVATGATLTDCLFHLMVLGFDVAEEL